MFENLVIEYFRKRPEIAVVYLFGSRAIQGKRGWKISPDIDLAILLNCATSLKDYLSLKRNYQRDLNQLLPKEKIDLVILNWTSPSFCHEVFSYRRVLLETNSEERVEFETKRELEYFDFLPYQQYFAREVLGLKTQGSPWTSP